VQKLYDELTVEGESWSRKNWELESQTKRLKVVVRDERLAKERLEGKRKKDSDDIERLEALNSTLEQRLLQLEAQHERDVAVLEEEMGKLKREASAGQTYAVEAESKRNAALLQELAQLRQAMEAQSFQFTEHEEQLQRDREAARVELCQVQERYDDAVLRLTDITSPLTAELEVLQYKLKDKEKEILTLERRQHKRLHEWQEKEQRLHAELQETQSARQVAQDRVAELEFALSEAKASRSREQESWIGQLADSERKVEALSNELEEMRSKHHATELQLRQELHRLEQEADQLRRDVERDRNAKRKEEDDDAVATTLTTSDEQAGGGRENSEEKSSSSLSSATVDIDAVFRGIGSFFSTTGGGGGVTTTPPDRADSGVKDLERRLVEAIKRQRISEEEAVRALREAEELRTQFRGLERKFNTASADLVAKSRECQDLLDDISDLKETLKAQALLSITTAREEEHKGEEASV